MKKKINKYMLLIAVLAIAATAALTTFVYYSLFVGQMKTEVRSFAEIMAGCINARQDYSGFIGSLTTNEYRLTVISGGKVTYDSAADPASMGDHASRPEVRDARELGAGESMRFSATLGKDTYYFAIRTDSGDIARVSKTTDSLWHIFAGALPIICAVAVLIIILCHFVSARLARKIVEPMNSLSFEDESYPYDELAPFIRTITGQRARLGEQMRALEEQTGTLRTITGGMKEGLILLDGRGQVISANSSAARLFESSPDTMEGKSILEVFRDAPLVGGVTSALAGNPDSVTREFGAQTMQVFFNPVIDGDRFGGAVIFFLDITERARNEKIRHEFSANVSHELKTPLTTILGLAEMIAVGMAKKEDVADFAGKIKSEANRLIALIQDIIKLSEMDENANLSDFDTFDLSELARTVADGVRPSAPDIAIEARGGPVIINACMGMIGELLFNLIDNGVKYNKPGGSVTVELSQTGAQTKITVADTGIGIPAEHVGRVFERFYRVDKSRSKMTGGTGLGLSIVKHIARYHGGYAEIISEDGKGTTVTVFLNAK